MRQLSSSRCRKPRDDPKAPIVDLVSFSFGPFEADRSRRAAEPVETRDNFVSMADLGTQLDIDDGERGLVLTGEIDAHTASALDTALEQRLQAGSPLIELDMSGVTFMDSSGLRVVIAGTEAARASGGDLTLVALTSSVEKLIGVSGLGEHLSIHNSD